MKSYCIFLYAVCSLSKLRIYYIQNCKFNHTEIYICISFITIDLLYFTLLYFTLLFNELHFLVWSDECLIDNNADE